MRSRSLGSSMLPLAIALVASTVAVAGERSGSDRAGRKGEVISARAVAPGQIKRFHVTAQEGDIAPNTLRVKSGQKVRITFVSRDAAYSIRFKDFGIKDRVTRTSPAVVEFVAGRKGTFPFRCTRKWGFKRSPNGTLIVE
ncbi:MAG: cupredoxin domain-containing protein [Acidobacteriota bacterium]